MLEDNGDASKDRGQIWIFGYGSLVHRPGFAYSSKISGYIKGWRRVWHQGSTDHRGTPEAPGRTVTLEACADAHTYGMAYALAGSPAKQAETLRYLEHREKQYDVRERVHVWGRATSTPATAIAHVGNATISRESTAKDDMSTTATAAAASTDSGPAQPNLLDGAQRFMQQQSATAIAKVAAHAAVDATLPPTSLSSSPVTALDTSRTQLHRCADASLAATTDSCTQTPAANIFDVQPSMDLAAARQQSSNMADPAAVASNAADSMAAAMGMSSVPAALHDDGPQPDDMILVDNALVYIGSVDPVTNANYLGPASNDAIARQIATAVGPSGHNTEYLFKLADAMREMGVVDQPLFELEAQVRQLVAQGQIWD